MNTQKIRIIKRALRKLENSDFKQTHLDSYAIVTLGAWRFINYYYGSREFKRGLILENEDAIGEEVLSIIAACDSTTIDWQDIANRVASVCKAVEPHFQSLSQRGTVVGGVQ